MISYGYTKHTIDNVEIHVYKIDKNVMSIKQVYNGSDHTTKPIGSAFPGAIKCTNSYLFDRPLPSYLVIYRKDNGKPVFITNYCYFLANPTSRDYGQIQGRCQGEGLDNRPDQIEWVSGIIDNDMHIHHGYYASWEYEKKDIILGYSPAFVGINSGNRIEIETALRYNYKKDFGKKVNELESRPLVSIACTLQKLTTKNTQTLLMEDSQSISLAVVDGLLKPEVIIDWALSHDIVELDFGDSGGSSYAYYYAENDMHLISSQL